MTLAPTPHAPTVTRQPDGKVRLVWADIQIGATVAPAPAKGYQKLAATVILKSWDATGKEDAFYTGGADLLDLRDKVALARHLRSQGLLAIHWPDFCEQLFSEAATALQGPITPPVTMTAQQLVRKKLPLPRRVVRGLLTEGAYVLGGKPKSGKSWLAYHLCIALAAGGRALGKVPVDGAEAAYLALEDGERRLKFRLATMFGIAIDEEQEELTAAQEEELVTALDALPCTLHPIGDWPPMQDGGLQALDMWLASHPAVQLLVVDTLAKAWGRKLSDRMYDEDYASISAFAELASKYGVCILIVTHTRKASADDPFDEITGSLGISGGATGAMVLRRRRGASTATLHVTSRDLREDRQLALAWDARLAQWTIAGDADEVEEGASRRMILAVLAEAGQAGEPLSPKDIAEVGELKPATVRRLLWAMTRAGQVRRLEYGKYALAPRAWNEGNTSQADASVHKGDHPDHPDQGDQAITPITSTQSAPSDRPSDRPGGGGDLFAQIQNEPRDRSVPEIAPFSENGASPHITGPPVPDTPCPWCGRERVGLSCWVPCKKKQCAGCGEVIPMLRSRCDMCSVQEGTG